MSSRPGAPLVLAVDIGTSSVRALVYDLGLEPVPGAEAHLPHVPRVTPDGGAELGIGQLTRSVVKAVDVVLARLGEAEIAAVGVSSFWHGLAATDAALKPLTPAYLWFDTRSRREAASIRSRVAERSVHRRTGCRIHPTYWPAKIAWLRHTEPGLRKRSVRWLSPVDIVLATLLGEPATSLSMASGTGLFGLRRPGWDDELVALLGLPSGSLPEVSDMPQVGLLPRWQRRWPALARAVWAPAVGDGAAANLGSGCFDPSRRALTIGTSSALRVTTASPPSSLPLSLWCYRAPGSRLIVGGALSAGGNVYEWLHRTLRLDGGEGSAAAPAGLTVLPLLAGERSPGYALDATGAVTGLTLTTTPQDLLHAALEAVAVNLAAIDRDLDRLLPAPKLVVASGAGLLANPGWMRMICDALQKPLVPGEAREASSRGAALVALEAAGLAPPRVPPPAPSSRVLRPRRSPEVRRHYEAAMARQTALYRFLVGDRPSERRVRGTRR